MQNSGFCEDLLSEYDFESALLTLCCYGHGANVSEAVQKIVTNQKDYHKCSSYVIVCWKTKIFQSITVKETSGVAKKSVEVAQEKEQ